MRLRGLRLQSASAYELCEKNVGVAIYPEAVADLVHDDSVLIKEISHPKRMTTYVLIYPEDHLPSPAAGRYVEHIRENIEKN